MIDKATWRSCRSENRVKRHSGGRGGGGKWGPDSVSLTNLQIVYYFPTFLN
jgi:hypothetical protein